MEPAKFADVNLEFAHVGGRLQLDGATVSGKLTMTGLEVGRGLFMHSKEAPATFTNVDLSAAHVGGQGVDFENSTVASLDLSGLPGSTANCD